MTPYSEDTIKVNPIAQCARSVADEHEEPKKQLSRVAEGPKSHKSKSWCPSSVKKVTRESDQEDHGRRPRE